MKLKKDQKSSFFFLFIAIAIIIASVKEPLGSFSEPGAGLIPFLAAFLLGIFSFSNLIIASLSKGEEVVKPIFVFSEMNWKNIVKTTGALFAFPLLLGTLGLNLTVFGFMLFVSTTIERRKWVTAILFACVTTLVVYLLFVVWLKYYVERGILGI